MSIHERVLFEQYAELKAELRHMQEEFHKEIAAVRSEFAAKFVAAPPAPEAPAQVEVKPKEIKLEAVNVNMIWNPDKLGIKRDEIKRDLDVIKRDLDGIKLDPALTSFEERRSQFEDMNQWKETEADIAAELQIVRETLEQTVADPRVEAKSKAASKLSSEIKSMFNDLSEERRQRFAVLNNLSMTKQSPMNKISEDKALSGVSTRGSSGPFSTRPDSKSSGDEADAKQSNIPDEIEVEKCIDSTPTPTYVAVRNGHMTTYIEASRLASFEVPVSSPSTCLNEAFPSLCGKVDDVLPISPRRR